MATLSTSNINIETPHVQVRPGLKLSEHQTTIVASVLDLFAGRPSLPKLSLWRDDATFSDQFTIATGREKFSAQWYGLRKVFSDIERINHMVQDAGNPMLVDLRTKYVVKGIGMEEMVQSVVAVYLDGEGKIERVEDRWDGKLPEGSISEAFRRLGAATVPKIVSVPKNEEEDARRSN
ncbi:hypothetical protein CC86DRAFT_391629 [Ophiobolus disseminans]|uniref:SnoaL-like domain-containing protein n=1 Tax=Ophiobolus disseminans TaxID=1469910 RepID=A0A6A7ADN7_9PLEO|nr:hypothetical protein CC86DRAFT_391629 [Ophiobolus disseminans]